MCLLPHLAGKFSLSTRPRTDAGRCRPRQIRAAHDVVRHSHGILPEAGECTLTPSFRFGGPAEASRLRNRNRAARLRSAAPARDGATPAAGPPTLLRSLRL